MQLAKIELATSYSDAWHGKPLCLMHCTKLSHVSYVVLYHSSSLWAMDKSSSYVIA